MLPPAIFIMGPTAAGKTDIAIALAKKYPVEIISVDSALVYKGMDIGTAKPNRSVLSHYPHHLVDIVEPHEPYSAGQFKEDALNLMADISARGKVPLLVGGTMLYFRSLQYGLADLPPANMLIREKLNLEIQQLGIEALHNRLKEIDPVSAARIHINDPQRLQRALEVYEVSGKSLTELTQASHDSFDYKVTKIIVSPFDRAILHNRIAERYQTMMNAGFIEEVKTLFNRNDCHANLPSIRAVGYRQAWSYLEGKYDYDEFVYRAIVATRQMAKRQLTWLRSQNDGIWFDSGLALPINDVERYLTEQVPE
ncbi:tRNA (adenosine(37)-N6)-dimethylallyltransferase MiaA, partial [Methylophaga sp. UBA5088]